MSAAETLPAETSPHDELTRELLSEIGRPLARLMASGHPLNIPSVGEMAQTLESLIAGEDEAEARDVFGVQAVTVQASLQLALAEHGEAFRASIRIPEDEASRFAERRKAAGTDETAHDNIHSDEVAAYGAATDRAYHDVIATVAERIVADFEAAARAAEVRAAAVKDAPAMREKLRKGILTKLPALNQDLGLLAEIDAKLGKRFEAGHFRRTYMEPLSNLERDLRAER